MRYEDMKKGKCYKLVKGYSKHEGMIFRAECKCEAYWSGTVVVRTGFDNPNWVSFSTEPDDEYEELSEEEERVYTMAVET